MFTIFREKRKRGKKQGKEKRPPHVPDGTV
jgi:hypothetical protein